MIFFGWLVGSMALFVVGAAQLLWGAIRMAFYLILLGLLASVYGIIAIAAGVAWAAEKIADIHDRRHIA